jgi:hypothetical protein
MKEEYMVCKNCLHKDRDVEEYPCCRCIRVPEWCRHDYFIEKEKE